MHVAAALGKPVLCFFGNSDARHWHPWGVQYELLQAKSGDVTDLSVDQALEAFRKLLKVSVGLQQDKIHT